MNIDDQETLRKLEEKLWIAEFRFDPKWLDTVLAEDFFEFGRSGLIHSRLDCLMAPKQDLDATIPLIDLQIRAITKNVVQTTYISKIKATNTVITSNRSSIWLRTTNSWQLKFHQGTPTQNQS